MEQLTVLIPVTRADSILLHLRITMISIDILHQEALQHMLFQAP